jgi:hypothetical protein
MINADPSTLEIERALALDCDTLLGSSGPLPVLGVTHLRFAELTAATLAALNPNLVILPLFAANFDAMTAIEALEALGYTGRLTILAPPLPKPKLVEKELRSLGPGARLTLISP